MYNNTSPLSEPCIKVTASSNLPHIGDQIFFSQSSNIWAQVSDRLGLSALFLEIFSISYSFNPSVSPSRSQLAAY